MTGRQLAAVIAVAAFATTACGTLRMDPPGPRFGRIPVELRDDPEWSSAHGLDYVSKARGLREGDDTGVRFGPYEATDVRHTYATLGGWRDRLTGRWGRRHMYIFLLKAEGNHLWEVRCESRLVEQAGLLIGSFQLGGYERTSLDCALKAAGDTSAAWLLHVEAHSSWPREGTLRRSDGIDGGCCLIRGDQIQARGHAVALVARPWLVKGRVIIANEVPERNTIAAVAAALLFQRSLLPTEPD